MSRRIRLQLHMISAWDALCAQTEAAQLGDSALTRNACVLARALYRGKKQVFADGMALLRAMPAQTVACWMAEYDRLCRLDTAQWSPEAVRSPWERLRWKAMRALGLLPDARHMTEGQLLSCVMHLVLDGQEQLERLCPDCQKQLGQELCPVCGAKPMIVNPKFDMKRFEELKRRGSSDMDHGNTEKK